MCLSENGIFDQCRWGRSLRREKADRPEQQSKGGSKNVDDNGKMGVVRGHKASHDFWGRQNCSLPRAPIHFVTVFDEVKYYVISV